jgi:hypothetical protein
LAQFTFILFRLRLVLLCSVQLSLVAKSNQIPSILFSKEIH